MLLALVPDDQLQLGTCHIHINMIYQYTTAILSDYTTNEICIYESYLLVRRQVRCLPVSLPADCSYAV